MTTHSLPPRVTNNFPRRSIRWVHVAAGLLTLGLASPVWAQTLGITTNGNFGTTSFGAQQRSLCATGAGGDGSYVWSLVSGALPPGIVVSNDVPSFFAANCNYGLIGVPTGTGQYNFPVRVSSAGQQADLPISWRIAGLSVKDPS